MLSKYQSFAGLPAFCCQLYRDMLLRPVRVSGTFSSASAAPSAWATPYTFGSIGRRSDATSTVSTTGEFCARADVAAPSRLAATRTRQMVRMGRLLEQR